MKFLPHKVIEKKAASLDEKVEVPQEMVPPPPSEMKMLNDLVMRGIMEDIQVYADRLKGLDIIYAPFADLLRKLAEGYKDAQLLELLNRYRGDAS